jgi:predicted O-methyltransferase YrrM
MNILMSCAKSFLRKSGLLPKFYHKLNKIYPTFESLNPSNLKAISLAIQNGPKGDYYEFGVYKGFSLWFATQIADALHKDMKFYGFDSFDGLPDPKGVDSLPDSSGNTFARGNFCAGKNFVSGYLEKYGADMSRVKLIKGFFEETLTKKMVSGENMGPASVILIDCDMYESTTSVLQFLPNIIQNGTIILFDDWLLTAADRGQRLAFDDWKKMNPHIELAEFCEFNIGKGFKVIRIEKNNGEEK